MKKIAILASGAGTNAENIYDFFANGNRVKIELAIYDRRNAGVAEKMRSRDVETLYLPAEVWLERPDEVVTLLEERGIDLVVLAGFLRKVPQTLTRAFTGRIINIHPSLLPAYGGPGMYGRRVHEAVIAAGETRSGATVHYVTDDIDAGEILMQEVVEIAPGETPESLDAKVRRAEFSLYPRAIIAALGKLDSQHADTPAAAQAAPSQAPNPAPNPAPSPAPAQPAPAQPAATAEPGREWAESLGVAYDPTKLPPSYPGATAPQRPPQQPAAPQHMQGGGYGPDGNHIPASSDADYRRTRTGAPAAPQTQGDEKMPPAYLVWSVVMTVLCCLPAGVVAIIFSSQVSSKFYAGDFEGAKRASERAQIWIIVSFVLGVLGNTLYLPLMLLFD